MTCTILSCASMPRARSALKKTDARELITELKDFIIKQSTRQNSAIASQMSNQSANMVSIAHSLIPSRISRFDYSVMSRTRIRTSSSTSTTLRQSGVPRTTIIIRLNAFMRITSKITGVNQICSDMRPTSVMSGRAAPSLLVMRRVVRNLKIVSSVMVGKKCNSIP